jgi:hypothetical protein
METLRRRVVASLFVVLLALGATGCSCHRWEAVAVQDDCGANDVGHTCNVMAPDAAKCTSSTLGQTAVCWDGRVNSGGSANPCGGGSDKAWCTYKSTPAAKCTGGQYKGIVYECK